MNTRRSYSDYDKYSEDIVPEKVRVTREVGDFKFMFLVDGYRGVNTGEIYYSRDTALRLENLINTHYFYKLGPVVTLDIPQVLPQDPSPSTYGALSGENTYTSKTFYNRDSFSFAT